MWSSNMTEIFILQSSEQLALKRIEDQKATDFNK